MERLPFHLLESLASRREQIDHVAHATPGSYLLPEELMNDAWHFCERALGRIAPISPQQLAAVQDLMRAIEGAPDDLATRPGLVDDPDWTSLRCKASATLAAFDQPGPQP